MTMRLRNLAIRALASTAIALPLLGTPLAIQLDEDGAHVALAKAWADRGDDHGDDASDDHSGSSHDDSGGGSDAADDHSDSGHDDSGGSDGSGDHSGGSGSDDSGGGDDAADDHADSGRDDSGGSDASGDQSGGSGNAASDDSADDDEGRFAEDRKVWLGASGRDRSSGSIDAADRDMMPVTEEEEQELLEQGWGNDSGGRS